MRWLSLLAVALLVATSSATASAGANRPRPTLSLHGTAPIIVNGAHFHRGERVKISSPPDASVTIGANARGTFRAKLGAIPLDRCSGLIVRARGSAGSLAVVKRSPLPQCLPARSDDSPA